MKTTKRIFLFAFGLMLLSRTANLSAQVTIGAETAPESYSLLELNTTTVKGGVQLPKLTTTERDALLSSKTTAEKLAAKGLTIFNTSTNCTDTWNGTAWISNCSSNTAPQITTQPRAFNWAETITTGTMTGINPANPTATSTSTTISIVATGVGTLKYQWYEISANRNATPTAISGATTTSYTPNLATLGMRRYFCRVTDANGNSIDSDVAEVAVGCGAKTVQGGWLTFMCYNLGATVTTIAAQKSTSSPVYTYSGTTATTAERASTVYGDLYQWGRKTDGHEKRTNTSMVNVQATNAAATAPSTPTSVVGKFIYGFSNWTTSNATTYVPINELNWRNSKSATYDPCAAGWRVPSQNEWASIFNGNSTAVSGTATANTWSWYGIGGTNGYEIRPDGITTTLFLPSGGQRISENGELRYVGSGGDYWSGTAYYGLYSLSMGFNSINVYPALIYPRANGFSVRCVSEF